MADDKLDEIIDRHADPDHGAEVMRNLRALEKLLREKRFTKTANGVVGVRKCIRKPKIDPEI